MGAAIFLAILFERIGITVAGRVGLVVGRMLGAFLGGTFGVIITPAFNSLPSSPGFSRWRFWSEPLLLMGMTNASILWLIFGDGPTGFVLRYVEHRAGYRAGVCPLTFSPDGRFAAYFLQTFRSDGAEIQLWNVEARKVERFMEGRADWISGFAFSADGSMLLARGNGVRLWNVESGRELRRFQDNLTAYTVQQFAVFPDGQAGLPSRSDPRDGGFSGRPPYSRKIESFGSDNNAIRIWNMNTGAEAEYLRGHEDPVTSVAVSPDGCRVLSGSFDGTMRLWDVARQQEMRRFQGHTGWVTCVAFCPDGRRALAGYYDWSIRSWDLVSGEELQCFDGHRGTVTCLAVSPDGRSFLSGGNDGTMRLWDLDSGAQRSVFRADKWPVMTISFSAGGRSPVSWSMDGTMRLWEPKE
jgi:WD40 repeat protein